MTAFAQFENQICLYEYDKYINKNVIKYNRLNGTSKRNFREQIGKKNIQIRLYNILPK